MNKQENMKWKILKCFFAVNLIIADTKWEIIKNITYQKNIKKTKNIEYINFAKNEFLNKVNNAFKWRSFNTWDLKAKNCVINLNTNEYFNIDITKNVLFNNLNLNFLFKKYPYLKWISPKNTKNIIYVFKSKNINNKFVYLLYKNKKLKIAALTSPWKLEYKTPLRKFTTDRKNLKKRSKKYNNFPMPFAVHLEWWYFIHRWKSANWKPASHWCFRLKWLASRINYRNINKNEKIPLIFTGYKKSF